MLVYKGYKFRLYPTQDQTQMLKQHGGNTRFLWNYFLTLNNDYYQKTKKFIFGYDLMLLLPNLKKEKDFLSLSFSQSLQQVGKNFDRALKDAFDKTQPNKRFPVYKLKAKTQDSFTCHQTFHVGKNYVRIPKIGKVRWVKHQTVHGKIKSITVKQDGELWFCSVLTEQNIPDIKKKSDNIIGVDLGIKEFAVFSDATVVKNNRIYNKEHKKLKKLQQSHARKEKRSNNKDKARNLVAKQHRRIRNVRKNFQDKITHDMITKYDGFVLENLNVAGMMKNHKLAKHIADVSWSGFKTKLEYKSKWSGKHFVTIDRWEPTSKTCNSCGWKNDNLTLNDRVFVCHECGLQEDRDLNAAKNIRDNGIKILMDSQELTSVEIGPPCHLETCGVRPFVETEKRNLVIAK